MPFFDEITKDDVIHLQTQKPCYYDLIEIDLSSARVNELFNFVGDDIIVQFINGSATLRLNETLNPPINLLRIRKIYSPFFRFYLSNTAQAGRTITMLVGRHASFEAEVVAESENRILNIAGNLINPTTEETLSELRNLYLNVQTTLLNAPLPSPQSIVLDLNGRTVVSFQAWADAATTFTLEASFNGTTWQPQPFRSYPNVTFAAEGFIVGMRFVRLRSAAAGTAGNLVSLILQAGR